MGLGPGEQRLLGQIERALRGSDPKLAAKLATFNRLTFHEAMPLRERLLQPASRVIRFAPLAMAAFVMFMLLISVTVLSRIGPAKAGGSAACGIAWVQGCQAAGAPPHAVHAVVNVRR
jgi:Protein of unknown function (DUF3040)